MQCLNGVINGMKVTIFSDGRIVVSYIERREISGKKLNLTKD